MGKKLILLGMAVAAVAAFAMPAAASASPVLTEGGTALAPGATVIGTSTNATTTNTALGTLKCAHVEITANLEENTGSKIQAKGTAGETATCFAGTKELKVTKPTLVSLTTTGEDKGTLTLTFIADVTPFECHFEGTGTFTYTTANDILTIPGISLTGPKFCLIEEVVKPTFHGTFTIRTANGTPLEVK